MKKFLLPFVFLFISIISFAQDDKNRASIVGSEVGKFVGVVIVAGFVIWGIGRLVKKNK